MLWNAAFPGWRTCRLSVSMILSRLNMCSCLQREVFHNTFRITGTHTLRQRWLCRCTDAEDIADDHPGMCGRSTQAGRQQEEGAGCV